jgi:hypothetical protein
MEKELKKKYLKYKKKYIQLKNQKGSGYIIGNFHLGSVELAMAEAIPRGTLQNQITQHGLGTGIYGFINFTDSNNSIIPYNNSSSELTRLTLEKPLILSNSYVEEGERRGDLDDFTWLSMNLNATCNILYSDNILTPTPKQVQELFKNNDLYPSEDGGYKGIPNISIPLDALVNVITTFLSDYDLLMTKTSNEEEHYVLMPINYLMFLQDYDGIYNINDDTGRTGSVKYFFNGEYNARGYRPDFKRREPLRGKLIFMGWRK